MTSFKKNMNVIDKVVPLKERRVKQNSQEWFDGEIADGIKNCNRLFKIFKKSKLHIHKDIYNAARPKLQKMITKKEHFFENKLTESSGKPEDLWKALGSLVFPCKSSSCEANALKIKNTVQHDVDSVLEGFRNFYSTLVENLVKMLPKPPNKCCINTDIKNYQHMILSDYFHLASGSENSILIILKANQVSKTSGIDNLSGHFLKDGAKGLSKPISNL